MVQMETKYSYRRLFSFFKQFIGPYKWRFFAATLLSVISSTAWLYNTYAVATIVSFVISYQKGQSLRELYIIMILWAISIVVRYTTTFFSRFIGMTMAEKAGKDSELYAIQHLSMLDISWHEKENTGNKLKKIDRGAQNIIDATRLWLNSIVDMSVNVVGSFIIISQFDKVLAGLLVVYLVVYYFIASSTRARAIQANKMVNIKDEEITGFLYEIASNIRTVKVLGMSRKILEFVQIGIADFTAKARKRVFWFQSSSLLRGIWEGIVRIGLFAFVIWNIFQGRYEVGFLVLFYGYFGVLTSSISSLSDVAQELAWYKTNIGRVTEMLDEPITIDIEEGKTEFPSHWQTISMKNLSFTYGDNAVLNSIDLEIKKGEKVGIVGLSGAGKSTLFKLLLKEYENYDGEILIGDVPLRTIKKSSYVKHIAAVLQDTEVFNMSLKQNIVLANSDEEENEALFRQSLELAHVNDFLPKLKEGIETLIGEKGVKLSGGERQRLGIARAVFKQPEVLFLDEATSHLDVESEQKIQDSLKKFFKDVTAVVIAHRLSTIKEMDRIIVIEGGKIIETGTFDDLYNNDGRFREFWDKQKI
jgi:ABC-type multidrug transport system fused ATPase/permease subunit